MEALSNVVKDEIKSNTALFKQYKDYMDSEPWDIDVSTLEGVEKSSMKSHLIHIKEQGFGKLGKTTLEYHIYARELLREEYSIHENNLSFINTQLQYILKQVSGYEHLKIVKDFKELGVSILKNHEDKVDAYIKKVSWQKLYDKDYKKAEMQFQRNLILFKTKINTKLYALNINDEESLTIPLQNKAKVPFLLWETIAKKHLHVQDYINRRNVK